MPKNHGGSYRVSYRGQKVDILTYNLLFAPALLPFFFFLQSKKKQKDRWATLRKGASVASREKVKSQQIRSNRDALFLILSAPSALIPPLRDAQVRSEVFLIGKNIDIASMFPELRRSAQGPWIITS